MDERIIKVTMKSEEREFFLIPSFRNLKRMQTRLNGERFFATANRFSTMNYGPGDVVDILYSLIEQDEKVKYDEFAEAVFESGFNAYVKEITALFTDIIVQGSEKSAEDEEGKNE